jgi:MFS transporter, DHA1 family, tetracycline resistance protein
MARRGLPILLFTIFVDLFGFGVVIPILPNYAKGMADSNLLAGAIMASYSLAQLLFNPIWGSLSDRFGRRPIILWSTALNVAGYFMFSQADTILTLFISRLLCGAGSGNISVAQAFITDLTLPAQRARFLAYIGAAFSFGFIFGAPYGGFVYDAFGFEMVGISIGVLCLLNLILAFFILPESIRRKGEIRPIVLLPFGAIFKACKFLNIRLLFGVGFVYTISFFLFQFAATLGWKEIKGLNDKEIALVFSLIGLSSGLTQAFLVGPLSKRYGEARLITFGLVGMGISIGILPFIPKEWFVPAELFFLVGVTFSSSLVSAPIVALLSKQPNTEGQGRMLGLYQSVQASARVSGPLVSAVLYAIDYAIPMVMAGLLLAVSAFFMRSFSK